MLLKRTSVNWMVLVGALAVTATSPANGQVNNCCVLGEICEGSDVNDPGNWCVDSTAGMCAISGDPCSTDNDCDPGVCTCASGDSCTSDADCTRTFPDSVRGFVETCQSDGTCGITCHRSYEPPIPVPLGFSCPIPETCVGFDRCILDDCPRSVCSDDLTTCDPANGDADCTSGTCSGSGGPCHSDIDCPPGQCTAGGPVVFCRDNLECVPAPFFTCTSPAAETCIGGATCDPHRCVGDQPLCESLDQTTCEDDRGGFWQSGLNDCVPGGTPPGENACFVGACCTDDTVGAPCKDDASFDRLETCATWGGGSIFVPGATCAADPCPVCEIEEDANCQLFDIATGLVQRCDLASGTTIPNWRCADDFVSLTTGSLNRVCWWPAFAPTAGNPECSRPGEAPADAFRIRIYPDLGHIPDEGAELGPPGGQPLNVDIKVPVVGRVWQYSAPLETSIALTASECYWLEITGEGTPACDVGWATSDRGNNHSMQDFNAPDFGRYTSEDAQNFDFAWCVSTGIVSASPTESGCGEVLGACCLCGTPGNPANCSSETQIACGTLVGGTGFPGKWKIYRICETSGIKCQEDSDCDPGEACIVPLSGNQCDLSPGAVNPCGGEPANDDCANAFTISHLGGDVANDINAANNFTPPNSVLTDIRCAMTDGPPTNCGTSPGDLSFDVWFNSTAQSRVGWRWREPARRACQQGVCSPETYARLRAGPRGSREQP